MRGAVTCTGDSRPDATCTKRYPAAAAGWSASDDPPPHPARTKAASTASVEKPLINPLTKQDLPQFFLLARFEHGEDLVTGPELDFALGHLRLPVPHDRDQPRPGRQLDPRHLLPHGRRVRIELHLDDLEVLLAELEQVDQPVLGHLVLDHREDDRRRRDGRRDPGQVEERLVARIVDARDHLLDAVVLARHLADDDVVLVVAGDRDHEIGRPRDSGPLQDEELRRVAELRAVLELLLEALPAVAPLLDQRHLVPEVEDALRQIGADLAAAGDEDVHLAPSRDPRLLLARDHARQSRPSTLPRLPSLGAAECALWWLTTEKRGHHLKGR